jgi:hypothetical protein
MAILAESIDGDTRADHEVHERTTRKHTSPAMAATKSFAANLYAQHLPEISNLTGGAACQRALGYPKFWATRGR